MITPHGATGDSGTPAAAKAKAKAKAKGKAAAKSSAGGVNPVEPMTADGIKKELSNLSV